MPPGGVELLQRFEIKVPKLFKILGAHRIFLPEKCLVIRISLLYGGDHGFPEGPVRAVRSRIFLNILVISRDSRELCEYMEGFRTEFRCFLL